MGVKGDFLNGKRKILHEEELATVLIIEMNNAVPYQKQNACMEELSGNY